METTIHYVKKVSLDKVKKNVIEKTGRIFYARCLTIETEGYDYTVTMFSNDPEALKVK